jgi:hypothetical protein
MVVLRRILNFEYDRDLWIETLDIDPREIAFRVEDQPVDSRVQMAFDEKERFDATVIIRPGLRERGPAIVCVSYSEINMDAARGPAARRVENVCRDCAHTF